MQNTHKKPFQLDKACTNTKTPLTLLHGNDTKLILLVDPGEEGLGGIVEDASALGPVALHSGGDQVFVAGHEEEMVVDQLQSVLLIHAQEREVLAGQLPGELSKCTLHQSLDGQPLLLGDSGGQTESVNAASDTDPVNTRPKRVIRILDITVSQ